MTNPFISDTRAAIAQIREYLAHIEQRLDHLEQQAPAVPSYEDQVAEATSTTAIFKIIERRVGLDRRTLLGKAERLVRVYGLADRFPDWSTNIELARYFAELHPTTGKPRLIAAIEALG